MGGFPPGVGFYGQHGPYIMSWQNGSKRCSLHFRTRAGNLRNCFHNNDLGGYQGVLFNRCALWTDKPDACIEGSQIESYVVLCQIQELTEFAHQVRFRPMEGAPSAGAITLRVPWVFLSPLFLAVAALVSIPGIFDKLPPMVVGAASALTLHLTADSLVGTVTGGPKFFLAVVANFFSHTNEYMA